MQFIVTGMVLKVYTSLSPSGIQKHTKIILFCNNFLQDNGIAVVRVFLVNEADFYCLSHFTENTN